MDREQQAFVYNKDYRKQKETWPVAWQGAFIWAGEPPGPVSLLTTPGTGIPREAWQRYCYLRKTITLQDMPSRALARVTAESRFILSVNGQEVTRGPSRSIPERLAYMEVDLAPYLRQGANTVAALVWYYGRATPWWIPAVVDFQLGLGMFIFEAPALELFSDASWKGRPAPYSTIIPAEHDLERQMAGLPEIIDGQDLPWSWNTTDFDDSAWSSASVLRGGPMAHFSAHLPVPSFALPELVDIAPMTKQPVQLQPVRTCSVAEQQGNDPIALYETIVLDTTESTATNATLIIHDAQHMVFAIPWIEISASPGTIIDVYAGEDVRTDGLVEIRPRLYTLRCIAGHLPNTRFEGLHPVGFRYLAVMLHGDARLQEIGATERRYPRTHETTFQCDDERLNQIWQVGARTLELCSADAFLDCPGREQRAWVGDSYIHALLSYVSATDWRLVRHHLQLCAQARRNDRLLPMVAAGDASLFATTIPDYSLHWIRALARYLEYTGDFKAVRGLLPAATDILEALEEYRGADGLLHALPNWIFIDWAMTERAEVVGAFDALFAATLLDHAWLLETVLHDSQGALIARQRAEQTQTAFEQLWDEERGVYVDAASTSGVHRRVSQHTNAMAILAGCAPRERWERILDFILAEQRVRPLSTLGDIVPLVQGIDPLQATSFDVETQVIGTQPFFSHFVHQAVALASKHDLLIGLCLRWYAQIERGNTSIEEFWEAPPGKTSRTHAWSATPTYDLTTHLLGVRPLTPGYAQAEIAPYFGSLQQLAGKVPTPYGLLEINLTRQGGTIVIPAGMQATLRFRDCALPGGKLEAGCSTIAPAGISPIAQPCD